MTWEISTYTRFLAGPCLTAIKSTIINDIRLLCLRGGSRIYKATQLTHLSAQLTYNKPLFPLQHLYTPPPSGLCPDGRPIIALPATTKTGDSRIVSMLKPGAGVVTTRAHVSRCCGTDCL